MASGVRLSERRFHVKRGESMRPSEPTTSSISFVGRDGEGFARAPRHGSVLYSFPLETDAFAPFHGMFGCVSVSGRRRKEHSFDGDGKCAWCNHVDLSKEKTLGR